MLARLSMKGCTSSSISCSDALILSDAQTMPSQLAPSLLTPRQRHNKLSMRHTRNAIKLFRRRHPRFNSL
ncbi:hypothetical protein BN129_742 [Cronobacter sakazakii 701]|nr:hypothetical protein BN129_742 [Cronobacter sakazakii 701]